MVQQALILSVCPSGHGPFLDSPHRPPLGTDGRPTCRGGTIVRHRRKQIWIHRFQTYLFVRIALYFVLYQIAVCGFYFIERGLSLALESLYGESATSYFLFFAVA